MEEVMELLCMISESFRMNGQLIVQIESRMSMSCAMIKVFHSIVNVLAERLADFLVAGRDCRCGKGSRDLSLHLSSHFSIPHI